MRIVLKTVITACLLFVVSCVGSGNGYTPKPQGYMRIELPAKSYEMYDTAAVPFRFERAAEAEADLKRDGRRLKWVDLRYPALNGVIFLSYIPLNKPGDLAGEVDTSYLLLSKHFGFSSGVDERQFVNEDAHVYATTYRLQGQNVASTYQFWATDSVRHFLRGSLYIDCVPNNDSLAPVLEYLQADMEHLIETLEWKN
ncbi:MAG: hypothetical protein IJP80_07640 [Bacteroidales bacterium]|nr:hypothetical protein [Bacteroidales bacterium]